MARSAASYGAAVLHKRLTMKHCSANAPQYEVFAVANMKRKRQQPLA